MAEADEQGEANSCERSRFLQITLASSLTSILEVFRTSVTTKKSFQGFPHSWKIRTPLRENRLLHSGNGRVTQ